MDLSKFKILVVDDEPDIIEFLSYNLKKEGFTIKTASTGRQAIDMAVSFNPHLILLDVMMPEMDGIETCGELRANSLTKDVLIAFLTARNEDYSQIAGFDAGGDDYISKPIKPKVLISRIKALLKRAGALDDGANSRDEIPQSGLAIDKERYVAYLDGQEVVLPKKEFELLALLHSKPQEVFTRDEIYQAIWGDEIVVGDRTIDVHIRKLREKLGEDYIRTVKGVGYKFMN